MICAELLAADANGIQAVAAAASQPADVTTCTLVLTSPAELSTLNGLAFPTPADAATAWAFGISCVVGSYATSWGVGAVLRFINSR